MSNNYSLKLVKSPFAPESGTEERRIFGDSLCLQMEGYRYSHGIEAYPISKHDHIATHMVLYSTTPEGEYPIGMMKFTSDVDYEAFGFKYPVIDAFKKTGNLAAIEVVNEILKRRQTQGKVTPYISHFVISPYAYENGLALSILKMMVCLCFHWVIENEQEEFFAMGPIKSKMDQFYMRVGMVEIVTGNSIVDTPTIPGAESTMLRFRGDFSLDNMREINDKDVLKIWRARKEYIHALKQD